MIAETKAAVTKLGLINDFPKRSHYTDLRKYTGALEQHCGLIAGSALWVSGDFVSFDPPRDTDPMVFTRKYEKSLRWSCMPRRSVISKSSALAAMRRLRTRRVTGDFLGKKDLMNSEPFSL